MRTLRIVAGYVSVVGLATVAALAQQSASPSGTAVLLGRVVDARTDAPISGAVIVLTGPDLPRGAEQSIITDAQGRFVFRSIPKGSYLLAATTTSNGYSPNGFVVSGGGFPIGPYLPGGFGQRRPNGPLQAIDLADGQRIDDAVIRMWKPGAIEGQVIDEAGEPVVGQVVGVVQVSSDGRLLNGPTNKTDDRGAFRFGTLQPGAYIVFAPQTYASIPVSVGDDTAFGAPDPLRLRQFSAAGAPPPNLGGVQVGNTIVSTSPDPVTPGYGGGLVTSSLPPMRSGDGFIAYPTTFYPSTTSALQASRVMVSSGEQRTGVTMQLRPIPPGSLAGVLMDDVGPIANMGVHLLPGDLNDETSILEVGLTSTDARGAFTFPIVPAGAYTIVVTRPSVVAVETGQPPAPIGRIADQPGAWGVQPVTVGSRAIDNVTVRLQAPVSISGEVRFVGSSPVPPADRLRQSSISIVRARSLLRTSAGSSSSGIDMTANGRVVFKAIGPPGRFALRLPDMPSPWTLETVSLGGRDITDLPIRVEDADLNDLVITYTDKPTSLGGTVTMSGTAGDAETAVFLMPADRSRWPDARISPRSFRASRTSKTGRFAFTNMAPGDYLVAAIADAAAGDWPDEKFMGRLATIATPVKIGSGQQMTVALTASVLR